MTEAEMMMELKKFERDVREGVEAAGGLECEVERLVNVVTCTHHLRIKWLTAVIEEKLGLKAPWDNQ